MEGVESIVCLRVTHRTSKHLKYYIKMLLITDYTFIEFHPKKSSDEKCDRSITCEIIFSTMVCILEIIAKYKVYY